MIPVLQETQILGPVNIWSLYTISDTLYIETHENYQKRSCRNRYTILTSQGPLCLTVPLRKGKNNQKLITDVLIAYDEPWIDSHCNTIRSAYGRSPFFEYYFGEYQSILEHKYEKLVDLNDAFLHWALKKIKLNILIKNTEDFVVDSKEFLDIRTRPVAVKSIPYPQVWEEKFDFIPNLSILDLLFCQGNYSLTILHKMQDQ